MEKSADEIDLFVVELEKELQEANRVYGLCAQDSNVVRRAILEKKQELSGLEITRHEKSAIMAKARENVRRIESEIRINKSLFWQAKKEGR